MKALYQVKGMKSDLKKWMEDCTSLVIENSISREAMDKYDEEHDEQVAVVIGSSREMAKVNRHLDSLTKVDYRFRELFD